MTRIKWRRIGSCGPYDHIFDTPLSLLLAEEEGSLSPPPPLSPIVSPFLFLIYLSFLLCYFGGTTQDFTHPLPKLQITLDISLMFVIPVGYSYWYYNAYTVCNKVSWSMTGVLTLPTSIQNLKRKFGLYIHFNDKRFETCYRHRILVHARKLLQT